MLVEFIDGGDRLDREVVALQILDQVVVVIDVVFVLDLADDLFQHVLDGHQTGHAAVFVDHDGHVILGDAEFAQQRVQPFGFRHHHRRAHVILDHEAFHARRLQDQRQQILGEQDADDFVRVVAEHREAAVGAVDDGGQKVARVVGGADADHL